MDTFQPQVTVGEPIEASTPSSPLVMRDPDAVEVTTDKRGRKIGARRMSWADRFEMSLMLADNASNGQVLQQAMLVSSICEFEGEKWARPATLLELRARIKRLDFEGLEAIAELQDRFAPKSEGSGEAVKN